MLLPTGTGAAIELLQSSQVEMYVISYQIAVTAFDLGIVVLFLSLVSLIRFVTARRLLKKST
ncbi:MAG: hypothetical protein ACJ8GN_27365 [Longimicrobiaceae bacterium]